MSDLDCDLTPDPVSHPDLDFDPGPDSVPDLGSDLVPDLRFDLVVGMVKEFGWMDEEEDGRVYMTMILLLTVCV